MGQCKRGEDVHEGDHVGVVIRTFKERVGPAQYKNHLDKIDSPGCSLSTVNKQIFLQSISKLQTDF